MSLTRYAAAAVVFLSASLLAGCAAENPKASVSPSPAGSASAVETITGVEALKNYMTLAEGTCNAAVQFGIVEEIPEAGKLIMVPKDEAYEGYSAVWVGSDGSSEIIFEADAFLACSDAFTFMMGAENGEELPTGYEVEFTPGDEPNVYVVTHEIDGVKVPFTYTTHDNLFATVEYPAWDDPDLILKRTFRYDISDADRALLRITVEEFLAQK